VLAKVQRDEWSRLTGRLVRITGDWSLAEDCVQEAFVEAWEVWARDGVPDRPGAWLSTVSRRRALDRWRRSRVEAAKLKLLDLDEPAVDDRLALFFTCCHPALPLEGQVALTLRTVGGLSTAEVARSFLVTEDTMTRRLTRAKTKMRNAAIPFAVPDEPDRTERLGGVLAVLYLLFNQGNDAGPHENERDTLAVEAIRLTRLLVDLCPRESEPVGALALMLLTRARRPARYADGRLITLDRQDRTLWDHELIREGLGRLDTALVRGRPGPYTLQAAIAGCHARAERAEDTDFARIAGLYARLENLAPSPVVRLNRAVAVGFSDGPGVGLELLEALADEPALTAYPYYHSARAELLDRAGRRAEAEEAWDRALALAPEADRLAIELRRSR
jgi:RNA polymerase sigma-70 factor (ECF subfamily)